jgi:hypothetical protein
MEEGNPDTSIVSVGRPGTRKSASMEGTNKFTT